MCNEKSIIIKQNKTSFCFILKPCQFYFSRQKQPDIDFERLVFFVSLDEKTDCAQDVQKTDRLLFVLSYLTDGIKFS